MNNIISNGSTGSNQILSGQPINGQPINGLPINGQPINGLASGSMDMMIATLLTSIITKKFNLDNMYFGILFTISIGIISYIRNMFDVNIISEGINMINIYYFGAIIILYTIYQFRGNLCNIIKKPNDNTIIQICDPEKLYTFNLYLAYNQNFFQDLEFINFGDPDMEFQGNLGDRAQRSILTGALDKPQKFDDLNFNMYGTITWRKFKKQKPGSKSSNSNSGDSYDWVYIYPELEIDNKRSKLNFLEYFDKITDYNNNKLKTTINLYFMKIIPKKIIPSPPNSNNNNTTSSIDNDQYYDRHKITIYQGEPIPIETREKMFIDSFFHKEKTRLWNYFKNLQYKPEIFHTYGQNPRLNLLLYGPPGSGKSSFIYRVARALERHIISIDLRDIRDRTRAYELIQRPSLDSGGFSKLHPSKYIIVLEEFDIMISALHQKGENKKNKSKILSSVCKKIINNDCVEDTDSSDLKLFDDMDECMFGPMNKGMFGYDTDSSSDFVLRDLLEIFQGTIPVDGSIIIATTNKFDTIKDMCPELFRDGRMTPVFFGYMSEKDIMDMCKYYFDVDINIKFMESEIPGIKITDKNELDIPTSSIIEKALEANIMFHNDKHKAYEYFYAKFIGLFSR